MNILQKIQNLPEGKKKIILWMTVVIIGLALFSFWFGDLKRKINNFKMEGFKKEMNFPQLKLPEIKLPEFNLPQSTSTDEAPLEITE